MPSLPLKELAYPSFSSPCAREIVSSGCRGKMDPLGKPDSHPLVLSGTSLSPPWTKLNLHDSCLLREGVLHREDTHVRARSSEHAGGMASEAGPKAYAVCWALSFWTGFFSIILVWGSISTVPALPLLVLIATLSWQLFSRYKRCQLYIYNWPVFSDIHILTTP